jgi:Sugar (and other) transporter
MRLARNVFPHMPISVLTECSPWLYPAEVTTLRIRSKGAACATMSNWIFNFLVVKITPSAIASIGYQTYIIFTVFVTPLFHRIVDRRIYGLFQWSGSSSQKRRMCPWKMWIICSIHREKSRAVRRIDNGNEMNELTERRRVSGGGLAGVQWWIGMRQGRRSRKNERMALRFRPGTPGSQGERSCALVYYRKE